MNTFSHCSCFDSICVWCLQIESSCEYFSYLCTTYLCTVPHTSTWQCLLANDKQTHHLRAQVKALSLTCRKNKHICSFYENTQFIGWRHTVTASSHCLCTQQFRLVWPSKPLGQADAHHKLLLPQLNVVFVQDYGQNFLCVVSEQTTFGSWLRSRREEIVPSAFRLNTTGNYGCSHMMVFNVEWSIQD